MKYSFSYTLYADTTNPQHMQDDLESNDFELTLEEMQFIENMGVET